MPRPTRLSRRLAGSGRQFSAAGGRVFAPSPSAIAAFFELRHPGVRRRAVRGESRSTAPAIALEPGDHVFDALHELAHVIRFYGYKGGHAQLVASEFAVGLGVDDSVGAQNLSDS